MRETREAHDALGVAGEEDGRRVLAEEDIAGLGTGSVEGQADSPDLLGLEGILEMMVHRNIRLGEEEGVVCYIPVEGPEAGSSLALEEGHHRAAAGKEDSPVEVGVRMEDNRVLENG